MKSKLISLRTGTLLSHYEVVLDGKKIGEVYQYEEISVSGAKRICLRKVKVWWSEDLAGDRRRHGSTRKEAVKFLEDKQAVITR